MIRLGVNIDHIATIREVRKIDYPDPVQAVTLVELADAYGVTVHIRRDRRHIKERDIELLKATVKTHLNIEVSLDEKILNYMTKIKPDSCCLVPERVEEITTEGGLDIIKFANATKNAVKKLKKAGIFVSVFIEPEEKLIKIAPALGVNAIEINTGKYSESKTISQIEKELVRIKKAVKLAHSLGLEVHAGHGLNYHNVKPIAEIPNIVELNIGHSIIGRAVFVGLERAIQEMLDRCIGH